MSDKSVLAEGRQISLAIEMIKLGARLQVLQSETEISRRRLITLYKEIHGESPPKGLLPFSVDWYLTWLPNIHSSLFYNMYLSLQAKPGSERMQSLITAYRLYLDQVPLREQGEPVLSLTRAWTLVRFFESGMMELSTCTHCHGSFVNYAHNMQRDYACGLCRPPARAGKTLRKEGQAPTPAPTAPSRTTTEADAPVPAVAPVVTLASAARPQRRAALRLAHG